MPNYRADQLWRILDTLDKRTQTDDDAQGQDENTIQDVFQPISEKLTLSDVVTTTAYDPSTFVWGGAKTLLTPSFARSGTAIVPTTGASVQANEPRYVSGKYGLGVMVEEGTTNLLTANQSDVETDAAGFYAERSATLMRDTSEKWRGSASLKVITPGTQAQEGVSTAGADISGSWASGQAFTMSVYLKGSGTVQLLLYGSGGTFATANITLTGSWQRYTLTGILPSAFTMIRAYVWTPSAQAITYWLDGWQVEAKSYATSWILGGTTRSAETLTLPTTGLSPTQGTIAAWVYVNSVARRQVAQQRPTIFQIPRGGGSGGILLWHRTASSEWTLETTDDGTGDTSVNVADSYTPDGWHHFAVRWNSTATHLFIDGVLRGTITTPALPASFASAITAGYQGSTHYLNTYFDDIHVSTIARADAEILAHATANVPIVADDNTLALVHFDGTLQGDTLAVDAGWDWNGGAKWNAS